MTGKLLRTPLMLNCEAKPTAKLYAFDILQGRFAPEAVH